MYDNIRVTELIESMPTIQYIVELEPELPEKYKKIAEENGELEETKYEIIEEFRKYIAERNECTPHRVDDNYLIRFLRARSWQISHSYKLLCNYYKFREQNKDYYENIRPLDYSYVIDLDILTVTPYRDQYGRRILIFRFGNWQPQTISVDDLFRVAIILIEVGSLEPISQVVGGIVIYDLENLSFQHILQLTPSVAKNMIAMIVTSMPLVSKALHIVNPNWAFKLAFKFFKPFLTPRMRKNLFIHSDMESLHQYISPEYLPKRYGGINEDYSHKQWLQNLKDNEVIQEELKSLGYVF